MLQRLRRVCQAVAPLADSSVLQRSRLQSELGSGCAFFQQVRGVKIQGNEIRIGHVLERDGKLLEVLRSEHAHGQGRASGVVQVEYRDMKTGVKRHEKLRPDDVVERAMLEKEGYTFMYEEGDRLILMHPTSFEQVELPRASLGDAAAFLTEGMNVLALRYQGEIVSAALEDTVECVVKSAGPSMKTERADGRVLKTAVLTTGATLQVPGFIKDGDTVVVKPSTGEFVKRKNS